MDYVAIKGNATKNQARFRDLQDWEEGGFRFRECEAMADVFPSNTFFQMSEDYPECLELVDFLHVLEDTLVVSEEARQLLECENVRGLEFIPVRILNHKGRSVKRKYYIANCLNLVDCIDQEETEFEWDTLDESQMEDVVNLTIDESKINQNTALFRMKHLQEFLIVRRELAEKISAVGLVGLAVTEIEDLDL